MRLPSGLFLGDASVSADYATTTTTAAKLFYGRPA